MPSQLAVIVVVPAPTVVTFPFASTVATAGFELVQLTVPDKFFFVAVNVSYEFFPSTISKVKLDLFNVIVPSTGVSGVSGIVGTVVPPNI